MNSTPSITNAATVVAQLKKDRVPGFGRGPGSINYLRSPSSLKIIQFNINGISTNVSRIKLDQVLELALIEGAHIIAVQETKLKTLTSLKIKGYNIFRLDRQNRCGGGLAFLIKNISYQFININRKITDGSNIEIQSIRIIRRGKPLNIFNMYHPPDLKSLPTDLQDLFTVGTICLGDLNAKHSIWGCSTANLRGNELLDIMNDKCFSILNDGTATHFSYSYNTKEALDISIASSDLGPSSDWQIFAEAVDNGIPLTDGVDLNWCCLKEMILRAEKKYIPRGLDSRTSNGKLWKLLKNISNEQPQAEKCNTILSEDGNLAVNDEQAADLLGLHYQKISRLNFSIEDRNIKIRASRIVHGCRGDTHRGTSIPSPDGIYGQMIDHLGLSGRQRFFGHYQLFLEQGAASSGLEDSDRHSY
ncbi:hypothetical protein TNCV_1701101 [Trichonephila clavipes]|nr:hypothetical protein TNCV_1701101 [Trichonephila clavipes]